MLAQRRSAPLEVATWVLLLIAAKRTETIRFLFVVQTLLLLAAPSACWMWLGESVRRSRLGDIAGIRSSKETFFN